MELDQNKILENLSEKMNSIAEYDLSSNTCEKFEAMDQNDFYQFALKEIVDNFDKAETTDFINDDYTEHNRDYFYKNLHYTEALHAACDKFLGTSFF